MQKCLFTINKDGRLVFRQDIPRARQAALRAAILGPDRRARQARWDRAHIKTASCRLTQEEMARFRRACRAQDLTVYGAIRAMIAEFVQITEGECQDGD